MYSNSNYIGVSPKKTSMGIFVYYPKPKQRMLFAVLLWSAAIVVSPLLSSSALATVAPNPSRPKTAVIVGGGPGGLAAALVLSNVLKPSTGEAKGIHSNSNIKSNFLFDKIVVLDEAPKEAYDPTRAYFFNINRRGQTFTNAVGIDLSKKGTGVSEFAKFTVPADPFVVFDGTKPFSRPMSPQEQENMGTLYWIPRHELVELITDEIEKKQQQCQGMQGEGAVIEFRRNARCEYIEPTKDGSKVKIVLQAANGNGNTIDGDDGNVLEADLCVGADGANSSVRKSLEDGRFDPLQWSNAERASKRFRLKSYITPSTGLRIKGMRVAPDFAIPKGGTTDFDASDKDQAFVEIGPGHNYMLESTTTGSRDKLNLSILAQKDPYSMAARPINICTEPNHDIWNPSIIKKDDGGKSVKEFFQKAHPRYDWDTIVADDEWAIFAATEGSRFPPCQYSPELYVASKASGASTSGVVLIGDALHSFPPDTGQGVNAAFCDVMALKASFEEAAAAAAVPPPPIATTTPKTNAGAAVAEARSASASTTPKSESNTSTILPSTIPEIVTPKTKAGEAVAEKRKKRKSSTTTPAVAPKSFMEEALRHYQATNGPETKSLVALARCGAPFQYGQASPLNKLKATLWTANVALRLFLNKVTFGVSPKPAILMSLVSRMVLLFAVLYCTVLTKPIAATP